MPQLERNTHNYSDQVQKLFQSRERACLFLLRFLICLGMKRVATNSRMTLYPNLTNSLRTLRAEPTPQDGSWAKELRVYLSN